MAGRYGVRGRFDAFVQRLLNSGRYQTEDEVVEHALSLLEEHEHVRERKLTDLRAAIQEGLDSGPAAPLDMDEIKRRARAGLKASRKARDNAA